MMRLPNGEQAIIEDRKLRDYVLNLNHPVGRHHAAQFRELLGIESRDLELLKAALAHAATTGTVSRRVTTPHGVKFEMSIDVAGPLGARRVRVVWIIEEGETRPRLVTCFVE